MTSSKEILKKQRILGCCNLCYNIRVLRPHEAGGYCAELLERMGIYTERSASGINQSIVDFDPSPEDLILIDETGLEIGSFKIRKLSAYGKRGHRAIRTAVLSRKNFNPWLIMIGVGPISGDLCSFVNKDLDWNSSNKLKIAINSLVRGLVSGWPNLSLVTQVAKATYRAFEKKTAAKLKGKKE